MPSEFDDLEGLTKEEIELLQKDPTLSKAYKSLQGGYTKKFQSLAQDKKKLDELQAKYEEAEDLINRWETWYWGQQHSQSGGEDTTIDPFSSNRDATSRGSGGRGKRKQDVDEGEPTIQDLVQAFNNMAQAFTQEKTQIYKEIQKRDKMLDLALQLNDVYRKYPTVDGDKILKTAVDKKLDDLFDAYKYAYEDDIVKAKADEIAKTQVDAELAKLKTNVESGSGAVPTHFEKPKEAPKGFSEASKQALEEIKANATK